MQRRSFMLILPMVSAGVLYAQEKTDRISGVVKSADIKGMTIEVYMRKQQSVIRKVMFDASTQFTMEGKAAKAADLKEGLRIVAIGKFEGVNLKATAVSLNPR